MGGLNGFFDPAKQLVDKVLKVKDEATPAGKIPSPVLPDLKKKG